ncbi:MAG: hypothetical protein HON76_18915 [Candidatus Scalindua sp.]|jgi:transglutaminase/protease-like cytokinesis protein 3|nr:hypothetical protein [Candidatus Scalindua sp.]MBT5306301.1 hypothetical protein [Candidatus Scalindua sp.]MBT6226865.1 hypothetical protein [Candidatus Scalindua sp.]MBT6564591.1 hypothetical protein [Candidatus Scalindua sp.]MBT7212816.1 hypothetical protein [Candidatus Scalindua sp.]
MANREESGQGIPQSSDQVKQEMDLVQKSMQNAREQFSAIQLSAQLQIQEEVKKAAAQIKKSQQFISENVKILQQNSSSIQGKDLPAYDNMKAATEKSSSGILNELQSTAASIRAAMEAANAATKDIENNEEAIMKAMMEAESVLADQVPKAAAPAPPQVAGLPPIPVQQPAVQPDETPQTEGKSAWMIGMEEADKAQMEIDNLLRD